MARGMLDKGALIRQRSVAIGMTAANVLSARPTESEQWA